MTTGTRAAHTADAPRDGSATRAALSDVALIRKPWPLDAEQTARPAFVGPRPRTYGAFAAHVAAVASGLLGVGAAVGDRVAIWLDKQPRYAEAILGALHAGCAYVPLDGGQPVARVETILADAEPVALFTDRRRLAALSGRQLPSSLRVIVLADEQEEAEEAAADGPRDGPRDALGAPPHSWADFTSSAAGHVVLLPPLERDDLAAILYTSGSTGTPKGVRISYRNLAAFIRWAREELAVGAGDVFAGHASFNFDLSTFDLFTALSVGAAVWIVPDEQARDVGALAAGIREHGVTVWYSVPSVLHLLTVSGALTPETVRGLRYVLFAGEVFPIPHLRALAALLPDTAVLYNLYGPTETNVCTYHRVRPEDLARQEPVPIGTPLPGARVSVVDAAGRVVTGQGACGELVVEGDCVTPGYWRRESEPAAAGHRQGRHATGDLVSHDGTSLVYRGRKDRMVKLAGYRVELGEIEAAVLRHPGVAQAAVVAEARDGEPVIALYFTLSGRTPRPGLIELKRHCAQHLPRYMLPRTATCLDELPHNANGKTDYHRLGGATPAPARARRAEPGT
ncbi:amino acid adenylation domain-containing protein [Streptomyces spectabilis]|uniref:Amino acid adenylation domain-containing protein n=2 Tax=Streptomyces spectabilis TaxID=68270 RepID=A0A5P2XL53_STRST|nr:amino acid adenylation domain-containing protein [Streptomyces spectabilis]MBB5106949.1 amino acid adenylation domain-containing protein [Streptomyces spectabilis]MCI3906321.1 amino acid adenylation domain-containing protein [Streptomyces spectabilis]QEV63182.1 D-alanine--poly(phosphoribitol) ligase [Streptomyces spectabilis]GGV41424.1 D-alanine--poly(phosphoribitol) ligase [Streptomyces spectabilis]